MEGVIQNKRVSIIMPVYNEEKLISECLDSLARQTFNMLETDFIIIDGCSTDNTVKVIETYKDKLPIRILKNEKKLVTYSLNIGIDNAIGDYIIRLDAHSVYEKDYIEKCVYYLDNYDCDNVGGVANTKGKGFIGRINAEILSSKFGVGGSKFRTETKSGYVDTVPFGAFRKDIFEKVGKFNTELPRSEDNDINSRIRKNGGKVYLASDIKFTYYCRSTLGGLLGQAIKNGNALFLTLRKNPKAMSLRHFIPFLFTLSVLALSILSFFVPYVKYVFFAEMGLYLLLDLFFSFFDGKKRYFVFKLFIYPLFHFVYGLGSILGLFSIRMY